MKILAMLFPPKLPVINEIHREPVDHFDPLGSEVTECGIVAVRPKLYRDGIERHFAESR